MAAGRRCLSEFIEVSSGTVLLSARTSGAPAIACEVVACGVRERGAGQVARARWVSLSAAGALVRGCGANAGISALRAPAGLANTPAGGFP